MSYEALREVREMREGIVVKQEDEIKGEVIKTLLIAQKRIAEHGNARENIRMARYLLKLSKQFSNKVYHIGLEESKNDTGNPLR